MDQARRKAEVLASLPTEVEALEATQRRYREQREAQQQAKQAVQSVRKSDRKTNGWKAAGRLEYTCRTARCIIYPLGEAPDEVLMMKGFASDPHKKASTPEDAKPCQTFEADSCDCAHDAMRQASLLD